MGSGGSGGKNVKVPIDPPPRTDFHVFASAPSAPSALYFFPSPFVT
jgi:hypothetical protein